MPYQNLELELEAMLSQVVESGASDLHLVPGHPPILRIDSQLVLVEEKGVLTADHIEKIVLNLVGQERFKKLEEKRSLDFSYSFKDSNRFRINAYYQKGTVAVALRFIPKTIRNLEELGLPPKLSFFANHKQGLVLVVGPTGHGKSTTLAALIDYINSTRTEHIITIEDPIEYVFTPKKSIIQQREIGLDAESFTLAIPETLREDVNVVMVGEMRDPESIASTMTVAETGHLVFATLHTNDAAQTVDRIIDSFQSHQQAQIRAQLASTLLGIISLRLVRRVGGGRIPAVETLITNDAVRNLIRDAKTYELINVIHTGNKEGMISLDQSLAQLVQKNIVSLEEARAYVQYPDIFDSRLKNASTFGL